jgi:hypothetical protein
MSGSIIEQIKPLAVRKPADQDPTTGKDCSSLINLHGQAQLIKIKAISGVNYEGTVDKVHDDHLELWSKGITVNIAISQIESFQKIQRGME